MLLSINKTMTTKILKILGLGIGILLVFLVAVFIFTFGGQQTPRSGIPLPPEVEAVADGIATIFMMEAANQKIAIIDAGNDAKGTPILEALKRRGKTANDVIAIFITHAHPDHDAAVRVFPNATVYTLKREVPIAEAKEKYESPISYLMGNYNPHPFQVTHPMEDGETVELGNLKLTAFAIPGHTPGSAVFLTHGIVFFGDAANFTTKKAIEPPVRLFSRDENQAIQSLKEIIPRLQARFSEIRYFTTSHTGSLTAEEGFRALEEFKRKH